MFRDPAYSLGTNALISFNATICTRLLLYQDVYAMYILCLCLPRGSFVAPDGHHIQLLSRTGTILHPWLYWLSYWYAYKYDLPSVFPVRARIFPAQALLPAEDRAKCRLLCLHNTSTSIA
jgi:hypothetical protein